MVTLVVSPQGKVACLWTEMLDLSRLGKLQVQRASLVEFDNQRQLWIVQIENKEIFAHSSRQRCLEWEKEYFEGGLK